jgi:peptide/nickel transport system substrate-binding protein
VDDHTIQFLLPAAYAAFPQALTFAILPQHVLKDADQTSLRENKFSNAPVGSGPFELRLLQNINVADGRKVVHLDANRSYYAGSPRLDHIQLHTYADEESMARALRTGEVSAASNVSSKTAESIDDKRYEAIVRPVNNGVYALFNLTQPVLKDANVRKALQLGTDTAPIRSKLYGNPEPLHLPFANGQVAGIDSVPAPKTDINAAKQLLDSTGWVMKGNVREKDGQPLRIRMVARKNTDYEIALQSLAGQWRSLGAEIDAQVIEGSDFTQDVLHDRNYDVLVDELVIGGDPDVFAYWHSRGLLNFTSYGNQTSDDALSSARTNSNDALRAAKYTAFARQWVSDVPAIGLYQSNFIYLRTNTTRSISNDESIISADDHYAGVRYWTADLGTVYKTP